MLEKRFESLQSDASIEIQCDVPYHQGGKEEGESDKGPSSCAPLATVPAQSRWRNRSLALDSTRDDVLQIHLPRWLQRSYMRTRRAGENSLRRVVERCTVQVRFKPKAGYSKCITCPSRFIPRFTLYRHNYHAPPHYRMKNCSDWLSVHVRTQQSRRSSHLEFCGSPTACFLLFGKFRL